MYHQFLWVIYQLNGSRYTTVLVIGVVFAEYTMYYKFKSKLCVRFVLSFSDTQCIKGSKNQVTKKMSELFQLK